MRKSKNRALQNGRAKDLSNTNKQPDFWEWNEMLVTRMRNAANGPWSKGPLVPRPHDHITIHHAVDSAAITDSKEGPHTHSETSHPARLNEALNWRCNCEARVPQSYANGRWSWKKGIPSSIETRFKVTLEVDTRYRVWVIRLSSLGPRAQPSWVSPQSLWSHFDTGSLWVRVGQKFGAPKTLSD